MTGISAAAATLPLTLSLRDRRKIFEKVLVTLKKRFYRPDKLGADWEISVQRHRPLVEGADTSEAFEQAVSDLLAELGSSHLGFFHSSARRASSRAALSATYLSDQTPFGNRWIFQDVHGGGAASAAGIESGDVLLTVDKEEIVPPAHPVFPMGRKTDLEIIGKGDRRRVVTVDVARPKGKKLQFIEPTLVETRQLGEGVGYLKIAMFPGVIGVDIANQISRSVDELGEIDGLIIDLRGNTGGGVGALRVMSLLTPEKIPVGFSLPPKRVTATLENDKHQFLRFGKIPTSKVALWPLALQFAPAMLTKEAIVLETEKMGTKTFQGRVQILVNRHTASAAEMIVAFARENKLARIVGEKTAGRLLSATSVKVGKGFRLALPVGAYYTWKGSVLEGTPIEPDDYVAFDWQQARFEGDAQLDHAISNLRSEEVNLQI